MPFSLQDLYSSIVGAEAAYNYRTYVYLAASASAEVIADTALCPFEAVKVRMQTSPVSANFPRSLGAAWSKIASAEGVTGYVVSYWFGFAFAFPLPRLAAGHRARSAGAAVQHLRMPSRLERANPLPHTRARTHCAHARTRTRE
jgi:hypothetical protein